MVGLSNIFSVPQMFFERNMFFMGEAIILGWRELFVLMLDQDRSLDLHSHWKDIVNGQLD